MNNQTIELVLKEVLEIKRTILCQSPATTVSEKWIPRSEVMRFFNYAGTQMAALEKTDGVVTAKVGKRIFILRESLEKLLDNSMVTSPKDNASLNEFGHNKIDL